MKVLAIVLSFLVWLPAAQAATVPKLDFRISVSWDFENEFSELRDFFTGNTVEVNTGLIAATGGLSYRTDSPEFDGVFGTSVSFFGGGYLFEYDFATGSGWAVNTNLACCVEEEYSFGPSGGSYEYIDDDDPYFLIESASLTNVSVTVESLSQVPLPAGGLLLLTGVLGLGFSATRRTKRA